MAVNTILSLIISYVFVDNVVFCNGSQPSGSVNYVSLYVVSNTERHYKKRVITHYLLMDYIAVYNDSVHTIIFL